MIMKEETGVEERGPRRRRAGGRVGSNLQPTPHLYIYISPFI